MPEIPKSIINNLAQHCLIEKLGMITVLSTRVTVVVITDENSSIEEANILAAHLLLSGVVNGEFSSVNDKGLEAVGSDKKNFN